MNSLGSQTKELAAQGENQPAAPAVCSRLVLALVVVLCAVPFTLLVSMITRFHLEAPYREQWYFMLLVDKMFRGTLTLGDLWKQESEHRHLFGYLLMLGLARLSHWNLLWELYANVALALVSFLAITLHYCRTCSRRSGLFLAPLLAVLLFSLSQFESWLWGFDVLRFMSLATSVAGMALLAEPRPKRWHFVVALLLGPLASYSFANGFVYWLSGGVMLLVRFGWRASLKQLLVWGGSCLVLVGLYAYGYKLPAWSAPSQVVFGMTYRFARFMLVFLGAPVLSTGPRVAAAMGALGLGLFAGVSALLVAWKVDRQRMLLGWGLGLNVVVTGMLIGAGRANFGEPLSSRYICTSCLFWAGLLGLLAVAFEETKTRRALPSARLVRRAVPVLIVALSVCFVFDSLRNAESFRWWLRRMQPAEQALLYPNSKQSVEPLFLRMQPVRPMADMLRRDRLAIFRDQ